MFLLVFTHAVSIFYNVLNITQFKLPCFRSYFTFLWGTFWFVSFFKKAVSLCLGKRERERGITLVHCSTPLDNHSSWSCASWKPGTQNTTTWATWVPGTWLLNLLPARVHINRQLEFVVGPGFECRRYVLGCSHSTWCDCHAKPQQSACLFLTLELYGVRG